MVIFDYEVFKYNWLVVLIDTTSHEYTIIVDEPLKLKQYHEAHKQEIWTGHNVIHYDQFIHKAILLGFDPYEVSHYIIAEGNAGYNYSKLFKDIPMLLYDTMRSTATGLKTLEAFMGNDIEETDVPFDIDRPLTDEEIQQTIHYCTHDVEQTFEVLMKTIDNFNAMFHICKSFSEVSMADIGESEARVTAKVLGCVWQNHTDEFEYHILPCVKLKKYKYIQEWFEERGREGIEQGIALWSKPAKEAWYKKQSLKTTVAGIPHTFGFGGVHGAPAKPIHETGCILHVDVNNYYPSMLIGWDMVTRNRTNENYTLVYNTRKALKMKQLGAKDKAEQKYYKKLQLPYKKMLNALSGAMKDKANPAYDPMCNNMMCINGQLMLTMLIERLEEKVKSLKVLNVNTDGIIIKIDPSEFELVDDICYQWECDCSTEKCEIGLALDPIDFIYQKDVNNYLWGNNDGDMERIGAYVKELSDLDYDLPIVNKALVDYMTKNVPVSSTINSCNDLREFQRVVKLSSNYKYVSHNHKRYTNKCYRVFASKDENDTQIKRCGGKGSDAKFGNTSNNCKIVNTEVKELPVPEWLDRSWYIRLAEKRLIDFGVKS